MTDIHIATDDGTGKVLEEATVRAFAAAVLLQAVVLAALNRAAGSRSVYLPFKMMFLLVPPAAVLGASALARVTDMTLAKLPRAGWTAAIVPVAVAAMLACFEHVLDRGN